MNDKKNFLWKLVDVIIFVNVLAMLCVVLVQVLGRLFSNSLPWTEELTRYCFLWTVNLGMTVGVLHANHASVTVFYDLFKRKKALIGKIRMYIYLLSCLLFFGLTSYWNLGMTLRQMNNHEISPALGVPMFLITMPLFLCDLLALIATIQSIFFDKNTRDFICMKSIDRNESLLKMQENNI